MGDKIPFNTGDLKRDVPHVDSDLPQEAAMGAFAPIHNTPTFMRGFDTALFIHAIRERRVSERFDRWTELFAVWLYKVFNPTRGPAEG